MLVVGVFEQQAEMSRTRQPMKHRSGETVGNMDDVGLEWPRDTSTGSPDKRI